VNLTPKDASVECPNVVAPCSVAAPTHGSFTLVANELDVTNRKRSSWSLHRGKAMID